MKKYIFSVLLILSYFYTNAFGAALSQSRSTFDNLSILVPSCDKYEPLWSPFFTLLYKNWPGLDQSNIPVYLIDNKLTYHHPNTKHSITNIRIPNEKSWSDNMLSALKEIKTDYVMIILEDYIINAPINLNRLSTLFETLKNEKGAYIQLTYHTPEYNDGPTHPTVNGVMFKKQFSQYRTSLATCIFNKEDLIRLLKPGESAWDFEIYGTLRSQSLQKPFLTVYDDLPLTHLNAATEGTIRESVANYIKSQDIPFDPKHFPLDTHWKQKLRQHTKHCIAYIYKSMLKPAYQATRRFFIKQLGNNW